MMGVMLYIYLVTYQQVYLLYLLTCLLGWGYMGGRTYFFLFIIILFAFSGMMVVYRKTERQGERIWDGNENGKINI